MLPPHISLEFQLDQRSQNWVKENLQSYVDRFYREFPEQGGFYFKQDADLAASALVQQIQQHLQTMNLLTGRSYFCIHKASRRAQPLVENPHIDGQARPLPGRFNLLLRGDHESRLLWWNRGIDHSSIQRISRPTHRYQLVCSAEELAQLKQQPDWIALQTSRLGQSADFVRTDLLHAVARTGQERVLISTELIQPWQTILDAVQNYQTMG